MTAFRCCAVVPTYQNPETVRTVVERIRKHLPSVVVVDDGSSEPGRSVCEGLAKDGLADVVRLPSNRGKGGAVRAGLVRARELGFSHAFQVDADGQHDTEAIPAFLARAEAHPEAAIFPEPRYDHSAPSARRIGREITRFWVDLEVGRGRIRDAMVGFRVYPVDATLALPLRCEGMDFDVEVAVLLAWSGVPIENEAVAVRYLSDEEGGRSHFKLVRDNLLLSLLHSRLCTAAGTRFFLGRPPRSLPATTAREGDGWLSQAERGTVLGIRMAVFWATFFGRSLSKPLVYAIAGYYFLFDARSRSASRSALQRFYGRPPTRAEQFRHVCTFAQVTFDRLFFVTGKVAPFQVNRTGNHHLAELTRKGQGAVLLGAHLGSFEAMRSSSQAEQFPLSIVGHWDNARMINALLTSLSPDMPAQVVHTGGDPVNLALTLRDRIRSGGMLAIMADRVGLNDKSVCVDFFGEKAAFATGPFLIASVLKCPVYLVFGLYSPPNRYELFCEPFAERIVLPRGRREEGLQEVVQRYAERVESYCRRAPDNWFNFYDFWETPAG